MKIEEKLHAHVHANIIWNMLCSYDLLKIKVKLMSNE